MCVCCACTCFEHICAEHALCGLRMGCLSVCLCVCVLATVDVL
jgi:hypothetical protein